MSTLRVVDAPIARTNDPITSFEAGENQPAREASELMVMAIFHAHTNLSPLLASEVVDIADLAGMPWTAQRIRTAIAQLVRKGLLAEGGRREKASPTGRAAMTYRLAEVSQ